MPLVGKPDAALPLLLKERELGPLGRMVAPPVVLAREEGQLVALLSEDDGFVGELGRDDASGRRCCLRGEEVEDGVEGLANAIRVRRPAWGLRLDPRARLLMRATDNKGDNRKRSPCSGTCGESRRRANPLRHAVSSRGIECT